MGLTVQEAFRILELPEGKAIPFHMRKTEYPFKVRRFEKARETATSLQEEEALGSETHFHFHFSFPAVGTV